MIESLSGLLEYTISFIEAFSLVSKTSANYLSTYLSSSSRESPVSPFTMSYVQFFINSLL